MPSFDHVVSIDYKQTFRSAKVAGMFDVPVSEKMTKSWHVDMPIEDQDWSIGLIVGASGSGKTTIAKRAFGDDCYFKGHEWKSSCFLDDFSSELEIKSITDALSHVGFSSPPSWLLPYHVLSNGQKFRADLARAILESDDRILVFDEFTSLVDRTVAKVASYAASKFIRKNKKKMVAVTCHYDVAEWLEADWIYDVSTMTFDRRRLRRPQIELKVEKVSSAVWPIFSGHHYLNASIHRAAQVYLATIEDQPVAITAILPQPGVRKNVWREHRTVVLPDYQGIGIGNRLSEHVGEILLSQNKIFTSLTSHPSMISYRAKSKKWIMTRGPSRPGRHNNGGTTKMKKAGANNRISCSFRYIGGEG